VIGVERGTALRVVIAAVALLALPATAMARDMAGAPGEAQLAVVASLPPMPMTAYGTANGASPGQSVIAVVTSDSKQAACGAGLVKTEEGKAVYVVDVLSDGQRGGCGAPGRVVRLYFAPPSAGTSGWVAVESVSWQSSLNQLNLTRGTVLTHRGVLPMTAGDGSW